MTTTTDALDPKPWETLAVPINDLQLAPTDVARFVGLDQCQRYLRIRLHQREHGEAFLEKTETVPVTIPPVLRREGYAFEAEIEREVAGRFSVTNMAAGAPGGNLRGPDNSRVLNQIGKLRAGNTVILSQARIEAAIEGWRLRGDLDLLKLRRDDDGLLHLFVVDIKGSSADRLEHHLQVAIYARMIETLLAEAKIEHAGIETGVLFRGPAHTDNELSEDERVEMERQREAARAHFNATSGLLEVVADQETYFDIIDDLVTAQGSIARRVAAAPLDDVEFHLDAKCDGCIYSEYCMRWSAERDDLSLIPHLTPHDKTALRRNAVTTVSQVARLPLAEEINNADDDQRTLRRSLATTWPLTSRLDELIYRSRAYRRSKGDPYDVPGYIPNNGYTSLPYSDAGHNPNLITVYLDAGHDFLQDRLYMLGARVVANNGGEPLNVEAVVAFAGGPPETGDIERDLIAGWTTRVIDAIVGLAAADANGERKAPIHLVFWDEQTQSHLLNGLARHFETVLGATPLYDFITQRAAFDTQLVSYVQQEIRDFRNYPLLCQSLQSVAIYRTFDWNQPEPFRRIFRSGMFDYIGKLETDPDSDDPGWFYRRARYSSDIPLEYAYGAWGRLEEYEDAAIDDPKSTYHLATPAIMQAFTARRLEAIEHIASQFQGNRWTEKTAFELPELDTFEDAAGTLAEALEEFILIEQHVELAAWRSARLPAPEQRAANGDSLIVRYSDDEQSPETRIRNSENRRKQARFDELNARLPGGGKLTSEQKKETRWDHRGMVVRLELVTDGLDVDIDTLIGTSDLRDDSWVVLYPRWTVDGRLPADEQDDLTPTAKQMLWGARGTIKRIIPNRDDDGVATSAIVELEMRIWRPTQTGFTFSDFQKRPFEHGALYTLERDPNNLTGARAYKVAQGLVAGGAHSLYDRLNGTSVDEASWPEDAKLGQQKFLDGLAAFAEVEFHPFEESKQEYIGGHGTSSTLLVQGPPGTGKSYATAFAILARLQGALAAGIDYRLLISCKTHAAIDVVIEQIRKVRETLSILCQRYPDIGERYIDEQVFTLPVFRIDPRGDTPSGTRALTGRNKETGEDHVYREIEQRRHCIAAGTPNAIYKMITDRFDSKRLFGHALIDCLIIDEASQIGLPEAMMAALPLKLDGQLIVVGDPRQMPPIIKHDWEREFRRTAKSFNIHESLFAALAGLKPPPPLIQFEQSFRLHADMAAFLRDSIYLADGIDYFSENLDIIPVMTYDDGFVEAALRPDAPLVVIVHDEEDSQKINLFERLLIQPILRVLAHPSVHGFDPSDGYGIVVPHRAQRALLQEAARNLTTRDTSGDAERVAAAVDTVERFQGGERNVIIVSATESDRQYLLTAGEFLYDPRRLTVALSRAKEKMILIASRSVFSTFVTDEDLFEQTLLWKQLLRRTCTVLLWEGDRGGHHVQVFGNQPRSP